VRKSVYLNNNWIDGWGRHTPHCPYFWATAPLVVVVEVLVVVVVGLEVVVEALEVVAELDDLELEEEEEPPPVPLPPPGCCVPE
jgi:hypothetical protein